MRIPGHFWWVSALFSGGIAAMAIVFPTLYFGSLISTDVEVGAFTATSALSDLWFMFIYALIFLVGSIYPIYVSAWYLWGFRRRRSALWGDQDAILPARPPIAVGDIPDPAGSPLILQWRRKQAPRFVRVIGPLFVALKFAPAVFIVVFVLISLAQSRDIPGFLRSHLTFFAVMPVGLVLIGALLFIQARMKRFQANHAIGVIATMAGLECVSQFGRRSFIPWGEARLFEVESPHKHAEIPMVYRLYSNEDVAEWAHFSPFDSFARVGPTTNGVPVAEATMARVIIARTGLQPRTLSKPLAMKPPAPALT